MPQQGDGSRFDHEDYSALLIEEEMKDVIDDHPINREDLHVTGKEVAEFYLGKPELQNSRKRLLWRELVSGQLDADRMDYLLRDSHHCGVSYGTFDLDRIIDTITFVEDDSAEDSAGGLRIGIEQGGMHAAEGLILARYFMFTQVYFHKTRLAFDRHASEALRLYLSRNGGVLPNPEIKNGRDRFLKLDDWALVSFIQRGRAERHGEAILRHCHDRCVHSTSEVAKPEEVQRHNTVLSKLKVEGIDAWEADASRSWYKLGPSEIQIGEAAKGSSVQKAVPLAQQSEVAGKIRDSQMKRIFVPIADRDRAEEMIKKEV